MNYVTMMINKKILDKKEFETESEAIDYFDSRFGDMIRKTLERQIKLLEDKIPKDSDSFSDSDYIIKRRRRLKELKDSLQEKQVRYEKKYEPWFDKQMVGKPGLIFRVGSIYRRGTKYRVVEEEHYARVDNVSFDGDADDLYKSLSEEQKSGRFLYIFSGFQAYERAEKKVKKLRVQIIREYKKDSSRL
ncbi:MAG: hypothetical protein IKJ73_09010 [Lachnospiraceae bacterium]|nr:hypothetical protein [Lachnospiraceae bacterium]